MQSMLNSVDGGAAAAATLLLEGDLAARELVQSIVDKISGLCPQHCDFSPLLHSRRCAPTHAYHSLMLTVQYSPRPTHRIPDKFSSSWADARLRLIDDDHDSQMPGGRQRLKISFKAGPAPACEGGGSSAAAIAAAATAAAVAAVSAVKTAEAQQMAAESRAKISIKTTANSHALPPTIPANEAPVRHSSSSLLSPLPHDPVPRHSLLRRALLMAYSRFVSLISTQTSQRPCASP